MIARPKQSGFSLVELSIVLVILGLLTGGILAGQSLIRAAELRSVTVEFNKYQSAFLSFRDRYFSLPGDMPNATKFWGEAAPAGATCRTTTTNDMRTCDGNGSGTIERVNTGTPQSHERFRSWQHLANAGLIEGRYTGIHGPNGDFSAHIGQNVPASRLSRAGWNVESRNPAANTFNRDYGLMIFIGAETGASESAWGPVFTPEENWNIDTKVDDGRPATGKAGLYWRDGGTCTDAIDANHLDSSYLLSVKNQVCRLFFINPI